MAKNLGYSLQEFGSYSLTAHLEIQLNSMCTVFAESEVVSLTAKRVAREEIAMAIHRAIINRVASMAKRFPLEEDIIFAGGCAYNPCLKILLEQSLKKNVQVASFPEMTGALGAALFAEGGGL
jgi:(R)-2-hydroxyacyl-CoA dehydratese activating ATPase